MILIVDDHADTSYVLVKLFRRWGYEAVAVDGGREALAVMETCRPALVILDCNMPCVDGLGVLRALRAHPRLADVPVVMFTADAAADRDEYERLGVQGWVTKASTDAAQLACFAKRYAGAEPA